MTRRRDWRSKGRAARTCSEAWLHSSSTQIPTAHRWSRRGLRAGFGTSLGRVIPVVSTARGSSSQSGDIIL
jgi:hypothetical protein